MWSSLRHGTASQRSEMLLSMHDAEDCVGASSCAYPGQLAYRSGPYKIIHGHPWLRGGMDGTCESWDKCGNGWAQAPDLGPSKAPTKKNPAPGQPADADAYTWGGIWLFDIEADPLEENDLSESMPEKVQELLAKLAAINATHIDQDSHQDPKAQDTEQCGSIQCLVPWMDHLSPTTDCGQGRGSCCPAKTLIV